MGGNIEYLTARDYFWDLDRVLASAHFPIRLKPEIVDIVYEKNDIFISRLFYYSTLQPHTTHSMWYSNYQFYYLFIYKYQNIPNITTALNVVTSDAI